MKPKIFLIALIALPLLTGCGTGSDSYITKHIVGSWLEYEGDLVLDKASGKILYEDIDLDDDYPFQWMFLDGGIFSYDGDVGTWTVKDGVLVLNFEDYGLDYYAVKFKNANEVYLLFDGDESTLSVEYEALLLKRVGK